MNEQFSKIEALLFSKSYDELSEAEKQLVHQELDEAAYRSLRAMGNGWGKGISAPAHLETKLMQAYRQKYRLQSARVTPGLLAVAALLFGLLIGIGTTWYLKPSPAHFINIPEIIVLQDTVYIPVQRVKKEKQAATTDTLKLNKQYHTKPVAEENLSRHTSPVAQLSSRQHPELMPQAEPDTGITIGRPAKAEKELMDAFVPMSGLQ